MFILSAYNHRILFHLLQFKILLPEEYGDECFLTIGYKISLKNVDLRYVNQEMCYVYTMFHSSLVIEEDDLDLILQMGKMDIST